MNYKSYVGIERKHKRRFWRRRTALSMPQATTSWKRAEYPRTAQRPLRNKISMIALPLVCAAWAGVLIFHPYFRIRTIDVIGTSNINPATLQESAATALGRMRWRIIPHNNFFLFDRARLETVLKTKFPIESIAITRTFPDTIHLTVAERLAFVILDNGEQYTLVDEEGLPQKTLRPVAIHERAIRTTQRRVGEEVQTVTSSMHYPDIAALHAQYGMYPVLYYERKEKPDPAFIQSALTTFSFLKQHTDFATHHFIYPRDEFQTLLVVHTSGITVSFNPAEKLSEQLETFRQAWQRELRKERNKDIRVNARYPGRVYIEESGGEASPKTGT